MSPVDWIAAVAAAGSCAAALFSWRSARTSHRVSEMNLLHSFLSEYGSGPMKDALRTLRNWHADNGSNFASSWIQDLENNDSRAVQVDSARRIVRSYYVNAYKMHSTGYCSKEFVRAVADNAGYTIFAEIVTHLDIANDPKISTAPYIFFHKLFLDRERHLLPPRPTSGA